MLFTSLKNNTSLESFKLDSCKLLFQDSTDQLKTSSCTQALEHMISNNNTLRRLSILKCHMQWHGLSAISNGLLMNQTITELHLESVEAELDSLLVALACNKCILNLTLKNCHLDDKHEPSISKIVENGAITSLDLSCNDIGSFGAIGLFTALQSSNVTLERLTLKTEEDVLAVTVEQALECNQTLKHLHLDDCCFHALVVESIVTSLPTNNVLETLSLERIKITMKGVWQMLIALQVNTSLKKVCLNDSITLDSTTTTELIQMLKLNSTLKSLYVLFDSCFCDENAFEMCIEALNVNKSLKFLSITGLTNSHMDKINFNRTTQGISVLTIK